jgi:hypothetical protein
MEPVRTQSSRPVQTRTLRQLHLPALILCLAQNGAHQINTLTVTPAKAGVQCLPLA